MFIKNKDIVGYRVMSQVNIHTKQGVYLSGTAFTITAIFERYNNGPADIYDLVDDDGCPVKSVEARDVRFI